MATRPTDEELMGLYIWVEGDTGNDGSKSSECQVDIIAIQGLGARPYYTWIAKSCLPNDPNTMHEVMWLRDLLPRFVPNARIATFNYHSDWFTRGKGVKTSIRAIAEQLLEEVRLDRSNRKATQRPIIFIGHSMGGLIIKQALVIANSRPNCLDIKLSTVGAVFLGTPHQGSKLAEMADFIAKVRRNDPSLVQSLRPKEENLLHLSRDFAQSYHELKAMHFYEQLESNYARRRLGPFSIPFGFMAVPQRSAVSDSQAMLYLTTDHSGLNKFASSQDSNFRKVKDVIREMTQDAQQVVDQRFSSLNASVNIYWTVTRTVNSLFTGRATVLRRIEDAVRGSWDNGSLEKQPRFVIMGMGGLGKSEICLQLAYKLRSSCWGVFWIDVATPSLAEQQFIAVAQLIGQSADSLETALSALGRMDRRWLLILDNADDDEFDYQIYFPPGNCGTVLLTTRVHDFKRYKTIGVEFLRGLDAEDAKNLLYRSAGVTADQVGDLDQAASSIFELLEGHPLALGLAGAYIGQHFCTFERYPQVFQQQKERLLRFEPKGAKPRYRNIYATFEVSALVLEAKGDQDAKDALQLLSLLTPLYHTTLPLWIFSTAWHGAQEVSFNEASTDHDTPISTWHVTQLPDFVTSQQSGPGPEWDDFRLQAAIARLVSLSLVTRSVDGTSISMHSLVHAWIKARSMLSVQQMWSSTGSLIALSYSSSGFSGHNSELWRTYGHQLRPHMDAFLNHDISQRITEGPQSPVLDILCLCCWFLYDAGAHIHLSHLLTNLFSILSIDPSRVYPKYLELYKISAANLQFLGDYERSISLYVQILELRGLVLGKDHPSRLPALRDLACTLLESGLLQEAITILKDMVEMLGKSLPETDVSLLETQDYLALAYLRNKQTKEGLALLQRMVRIRGTAFSTTDTALLRFQEHLACAYRENAQVEEAISLLEQVVETRELSLVAFHPDLLTSKIELALAYQQNGQVRKALARLEHVARVEETTLLQTDTRRLDTQHKLAYAYHQNGQLQEAINQLECVVRVPDTTLWHSRPERLVIQQELANLYLENGQTQEAIKLLKSVLRTQEMTLTEADLDRLRTQDRLAMAYLDDGQTGAAIKLLEGVVRAVETTLTEDHPLRMEYRFRLAMLWYLNDEFTKALAHMVEVFQWARCCLSPNDFIRQVSESSLADMQRQFSLNLRGFRCRCGKVLFQVCTMPPDPEAIAGLDAGVVNFDGLRGWCRKFVAGTDGLVLVASQQSCSCSRSSWPEFIHRRLTSGLRSGVMMLNKTPFQEKVPHPNHSVRDRYHPVRRASVQRYGVVMEPNDKLTLKDSARVHDSCLVCNRATSCD